MTRINSKAINLSNTGRLEDYNTNQREKQSASCPPSSLSSSSLSSRCPDLFCHVSVSRLYFRVLFASSSPIISFSTKPWFLIICDFTVLSSLLATKPSLLPLKTRRLFLLLLSFQCKNKPFNICLSIGKFLYSFHNISVIYSHHYLLRVL